jgi:hypothetical protein
MLRDAITGVSSHGIEVERGDVAKYSRICANCGATVSLESAYCNLCSAHASRPDSGAPRFGEKARETGESLGGLLALHAVDVRRVRFVGWCPAGAFGIDAHGEVSWIHDWGYMAEVTIESGQLRLAGRVADLDTGELL